MRRKCYFLVYRRSSWQETLREPTGGLVMDPEHIVDGHPVADIALAFDMVAERYHAGRHETLFVEEVMCKRSCKLAQRLHDRWEREALEFRELMKVSE